MLSDSLKKSIRHIHKNIATNLSDYKSRPSQNYIVAEIAKSLAGEHHKSQRISVIEAGTGTGKSLAYCLGVIPFAIKHKKKVVISTATVALQEQLIEKELPFFKQHSGLDFSFDLAKGRNRYLCSPKLTLANNNEQAQIQFSALATQPLNDAEQSMLCEIKKEYLAGRYLGDRDSWPAAIPDKVWQLIASDKHACQRQLKEHTHCPFHTARNKLSQMDVLVVNHSLLLADLELGGGTILPEPSDTIYVIDEAHHLPHITRDFSSASSTLQGAMDWIEKLAKFNQKMSNAISTARAIGLNFKLADALNDCQKDLKAVKTYLADNYFEFNDDNIHRFIDGELPKFLTPLVKNLKESSSNMHKHLRKMHDALTLDVNDGDVKAHVAEPLLSESGVYLNRLENFSKLWSNLSIEKASTPHARWLKQLEYKNSVDYLLADCPIEVGFYLKDKLWQECAGAVLCSATLSALGTFDHFAFEAGLKNEPGVQYLKVPSPFDYPQQALLHLPTTEVEPTHKEFTDTLCQIIPKYIKKNEANLILFASYWQMDQVAKSLRQRGLSILVQGEASREALLNLHREKVTGGNGSILLGTQSLSEGLDLPGKLLTNLIITKIPFAVPTSPIEQAQNEYIEKKGGNPFLSITVPEASKKLVQSCGRLLRKESDSGVITILDRRLVSKRYGKAMLDALPPFKRQIDY